MKIGFDISALSLPRSGIGRYQHQLLKALFELDRENEYLLYGFNLRNRQRFEQTGLEGSNVKQQIHPIPQRLITGWWQLSRFPAVDRFAGDPDVIQISEICAQPVRKARSVAFVHDLTPLLFPEHHVWSNRFLHNRRLKKLGGVDHILTNSQATKHDLIRYSSVNPERITVTPLGADEAFCPLPNEAVKAVLNKYLIDMPYILFVGTLEPRKNIPLLIDAFNLFKHKYGTRHRLVLAGQKGWLYNQVFAAMQSSPFSQDIIYLDYIPDEDLPALMNGAEVFVYPSRYEGFGLPLLEAMQCGTPVITTNVSALPEVGGSAALYIEPGDSAALAQQLFNVLSDPHYRKELSGRCIEQARRFNWRHTAEKTLSVYRALL